MTLWPSCSVADIFLRFLPLRQFLQFLDPYPPATEQIFLRLRQFLRFLDPLPSQAKMQLASISSFASISSISDPLPSGTATDISSCALISSISWPPILQHWQRCRLRLFLRFLRLRRFFRFLTPYSPARYFFVCVDFFDFLTP